MSNRNQRMVKTISETEDFLIYPAKCPIVNPDFLSLDKENGAEPDHMETEREEDLRLVLVGKTGSGKSASGNTILGQRQFLSQISASSVTQICEQGSAELVEDVEDAEASTCRRKRRVMRRVLVVDMPGFGDTHLSMEKIHAEIAKCVSLSAPGPHAFLLVVPIGRYSDSENEAVCEMAKIFGEDAICNHTVIIFTRGDDLDGLEIEEYLNQTAPAKLKALIDRCGGRYHVLNNKDPSNSAQVKELLMKVDKMVKQTEIGYYTNAMFLEAEAAIREEEKKMLREREQAQGEEQGGRKEGEDRGAKRQKCDLESKGTESSEFRSQRPCKMGLEKMNEAHFRVERWAEESTNMGLSSLREQLKDRRRGGGRVVSRRQALRSSLSRLRREAALSPKVLERVKILVAAGATGMAVGAMFGAAAPLAAAAGASLMGNSVGFAASQLACASVTGGTGVGKAVGAIVAAATGTTAVSLGAATGGVLGGCVGAVAGTEATSPGVGALDALEQVSIIGASAVGVAAGFGSTLGAGAAVGAALEGAALSTAALSGADAAAGVANASLASAAGQHAVATAASGTVGVAAPAAGAAVAQEMVASVTAVTGSAGALCGVTGPSMASAARVMSDPCSTVSTATRILNAVADIGKAAASIALAGGVVVKVMKEKVRGGTGTTENSYSERNSYEIYWNK